MTRKSNSWNEEITKKLTALEEAIEKAKDKRFEYYDNRLKDIHSVYRNILIVVTLLIVVIQAIQYFNLHSQKSEIEKKQQDQKTDFEKMQKALKEEIALELGKSKEIPQIELYTGDGELISNQSVLEGTVEIRTATKDDIEKVRFPFLYDKFGHSKWLRIRLVVKNKGGASTEKIWAMIYTKDPLIPIHYAAYNEKSHTGEEGFNYLTGGLLAEGLFPPNTFFPSNLTIRLSNDFDPRIHKKLYPLIVKTSYGTKEIVTTKFLLRIAPKPIIIPFESE